MFAAAMAPTYPAAGMRTVEPSLRVTVVHPGANVTHNVTMRSHAKKFFMDIVTFFLDLAVLVEAPADGLRFSCAARTGDRSTYAEPAAGCVGCKRELDRV